MKRFCVVSLLVAPMATWALLFPAAQAAEPTLAEHLSAIQSLYDAQASALAVAQAKIAALEAEVKRLNDLLNPPAPAPEVTIWGAAAPLVADWGDAAAYELGVKFRSSSAGTIQGLRFYKSAANGGTHVGHLWTIGGTQLAAVTFADETASGWQEARFAVPVTIQAGTLYVVSVHMPQGHYSATIHQFDQPVTNGALTAVAAAESPNGVYKAGSAGFPGGSNSGNAHYWVDVIFAAQGTVMPPPLVPVTVAWDPPITNADGTPLGDLAGFKLAWGDALGVYGAPLDVGLVNETTLTVQRGTVWIVALAYDSTGNTSAWSQPLEVTVDG